MDSYQGSISQFRCEIGLEEWVGEGAVDKKWKAYSIINEDFSLLLPFRLFNADRSDHVESRHAQFFLGVDPALFLLHWTTARFQWWCFAFRRFSLL